MDMSAALRLYNPEDLGVDGYPSAWHPDSWQDNLRCDPVKDIVREIAGHRCERCNHPYLTRRREPRISQGGQWSPCDMLCAHGGPTRRRAGGENEAQWRILTVHHLNGVKWDCRWWNLAALCQRCHLAIQAKVLMERVCPLEHSEWFKPHAAGWYAAAYLGEDLTRRETLARLDELLALERVEGA
jgi:hypothetical protein